eukprot:SAG25_NODE_655_length_6126_cov_12.125270_9_plen_115_part_00
MTELHQILNDEIGADIRDEPQTADNSWDPDTDAAVGDLVAVKELVVVPTIPASAFNQDDVPSMQCVRCPEDEVEETQVRNLCLVIVIYNILYIHTSYSFRWCAVVDLAGRRRGG